MPAPAHQVANGAVGDVIAPSRRCGCPRQRDATVHVVVVMRMVVASNGEPSGGLMFHVPSGSRWLQ
jgi:hypothetical protein